MSYLEIRSTDLVEFMKCAKAYDIRSKRPAEVSSRALRIGLDVHKVLELSINNARSLGLKVVSSDKFIEFAGHYASNLVTEQTDERTEMIDILRGMPPILFGTGDDFLLGQPEKNWNLEVLPNVYVGSRFDLLRSTGVESI